MSYLLDSPSHLCINIILEALKSSNFAHSIIPYGLKYSDAKGNRLVNLVVPLTPAPELLVNSCVCQDL
jgi:hypothetical protein